LRQWYLRITEYADRLLESLQNLSFSDSMKEMQSNWIGKSFGAEMDFTLEKDPGKKLRVYTTRPDTIFGVDFMVVAPEHEMIHELTTAVENQLSTTSPMLKAAVNGNEWPKRKLPAVLPDLMYSILLTVVRFRFGFQNMCWQVMVPAQSWLFPAEMNEILNSQGISIFS
jgi:hypothetical protein